MAMDLHIVSDDAAIEQVSERLVDLDSHHHSTKVDPSDCIDAGGHCSHHQAHTTGLVVINTFSNRKSSSVLFSVRGLSLRAYTQAPPLRPPKI